MDARCSVSTPPTCTCFLNFTLMKEISQEIALPRRVSPGATIQEVARRKPSTSCFGTFVPAAFTTPGELRCARGRWQPPATGPHTTGLAASPRSLCAEPAASVDPGRSALRPAERDALSRASRCRGRSGPRPRGTVSLPCRPCRAWGRHRLTTIIKSNNSIQLTNNALQHHRHFRTDYKF